MSNPRVEQGSLGDLRPDPENAKRHNERNLAAIETSGRETGAMRSVVVTSDYTIIAGNATVEAFGAIGLEDAIFVHSDGTKLLVHVRDDVKSGSDVARLAGLYDNRTAELAPGYDAEVLDALMRELPVAPVVMTPTEAAVLMAGDREPDTSLAEPPMHECPSCHHRWRR